MTKVLPEKHEPNKSTQEDENLLLTQLGPSPKLAPARALATWFCKKYAILAILPALIQVLLYSLPVLMSGRPYNSNDAYFLYAGESLLFPLGLIFGLVLVHKLFSFQHKAQGANLIYALPLTRGQLYLTLLASAALLLGLTRLASLLQNSLLYLAKGVDLPFIGLVRMEVSLYLKIWLALALLIFFYAEGFNSFNAQLLAIFINIFWPLLFFVLQILAQACLPSCAGFDWSGPLPLLLAPYLSGFWPGPWQGWTLWIRLITGLGFLLIAFLSFLKRPAENLARYDVEAPAFILPRAVISLASGLSMGLVLYFIRKEITQEAPGWFIFILGLVLGSLLANLLQDLLYSRGVVKLSRALAKALLLTLPGLITVALLASGFFGYDFRLPQSGEKTKIRLEYISDGRQNFPLVNIFGVYPPYEGGWAGDQVLPKCWQLDDPAQKAFFIQLLDKAYEEGQAGLTLPRDLTSYDLYWGLSDENDILTTEGLLDIAITWQNAGSPFRHKRILPLADQSLESLAPLLKDPAMAAFFYKLAYANLDQVYLIHNGETVKPLAKSSADQTAEPAPAAKLSLNSNWQELWQAYELHQQKAEELDAYLPDFARYSDRLLYALMADYSKMTPEEREDLAEQGEIQLSLHFRDRLSQIMRQGPMSLYSNLQMAREKTETLKLPVKENFTLSKQVLLDLLQEQDLALTLQD